MHDNGLKPPDFARRAVLRRPATQRREHDERPHPRNAPHVHVHAQRSLSAARLRPSRAVGTVVSIPHIARLACPSCAGQGLSGSDLGSTSARPGRLAPTVDGRRLREPLAAGPVTGCRPPRALPPRCPTDDRSAAARSAVSCNGLSDGLTAYPRTAITVRRACRSPLRQQSRTWHGACREYLCNPRLSCKLPRNGRCRLSRDR